jgi:hypothetical protein
LLSTSQNTSEDQHKDFDFSPMPRFWVEETNIEWPSRLHWAIAFRDVARVTDVRTCIAAAIPEAAVGNTLPILIPADGSVAAYRRFGPLLLGNMNAFVFDFVARNKVQSAHLNWYILEQLPILPENAYERLVGKARAADLLREEVLRLTFTSNDMKGFAEDLGYSGKPFEWDEECRRHSRARLDALYFMLYLVNREDAAYILDTFPIVRSQDEATFNRYVTKDLTLAYMAAFEAGDTEAKVVLR